MNILRITPRKTVFPFMIFINIKMPTFYFFNVIKPEDDSHWILALEASLEKKLDPKIRSGRIG